MNATMASGADPDGGEVQVEHWTPIMRELSRVVDRAKDRRAISDDTDPESVVYLLASPFLVHTMFFHAEPAPQLVELVACAVSRAFAAVPT